MWIPLTRFKIGKDTLVLAIIPLHQRLKISNPRTLERDLALLVPGSRAEVMMLSERTAYYHSHRFT